MRDKPLAREANRVEPEYVDFDRFTSYEDGDATVVCDRKNPNAWLRSDAVVDLES